MHLVILKLSSPFQGWGSSGKWHVFASGFSPKPPGYDPGGALPLCLAVYLSYELKPEWKSTKRTKVLQLLAIFGLNPPGTLCQAEIASALMALS